MDRTFKNRFAKMSVSEISESIQCINQLGKLSEEELATRGLKMEEPQQINHFLNAVNEGQSTLLPEQAATLLRLTPNLLKNGNTTVHRILLIATPKVVDSYKNTEKPEEKLRLGKILKRAGLVCVDKHLKTAGLDVRLRLRELETFRPFIGGNPEYQEAVKRFHAAHKIMGFTGMKGNFNESEKAMPARPTVSYDRGIGYE